MAITIKHTEKIGAGLLLLLSAGIFAVTADFPSGPGETGAAFFPRILAVLIGAFALLQLIRSGYRDKRREHDVSPDAVKRVSGAFLLVVGYALALPWVGFVTGTIAFLTVAMRYSGVESIPRMIGVSTGITLLLYYVFAVFLRVPLPESPLVPVARYLPSTTVGVLA